MTTDSPTPRRRGAQPGNTNALKHGAYSLVLNAAAQRRLSAARELNVNDLTEEINICRERVMAVLEHAPESFDTWAVVMRTLLRAVAVQFAMRPTAAMRLESAGEAAVADMANLLGIADRPA